MALLDVDDTVNATEAMIAERGGRSAVFPCDMTDDGQVAAVVDEVHRRWGRIDVLFNNVGTAVRPGPSWTSISEHGTAAWR